MNKKIMIVWFFLVFGILLSIVLIGLSQKDLKYMKFEHSIVLAGRSYIKTNKIKTKINESFVIFKDDIKEKVDNKKLEEYCIDNITFYNGILIDKYIVNRKCDKESNNNENAH